ncbi:MAG: carboxymuconolactone decarboxylase family protein [Alphaproteobacteria bacterium]|nr:MAG: carboxymuconolactone decarboxylase family protein [Alphaproteobacteria bacterium]
MSHVATPAMIADAPEASQALLTQVKKTIGSIPNMFRLVSNSPAALEGYLGLHDALGKGALDAATRERIALAIGQYNECGYCLAAHSYIGQHVAKLTGNEIAANRKGFSTDAKADAAVRFAVSVARAQGNVSAGEVETVRKAGYSDGEIVEIIVHVALNTLTNYVNRALQTEIDFPVVDVAAA